MRKNLVIQSWHLMGWIECELFGFDCPDFADVFEGREALEGFETASIIVGIDGVVEMRRQLRMAVIMVPFDGSLLDRAVHPFDLSVGPGMLDFGEPVLDPVFFAPHVEHVGHPGCCGTIGIARREGELDTVVGQHCVDFVWHGFDQRDQEGRSCHPVRLGHQLDEDEFAGTVDAYIQVQLALGGANLGDVDMEVADGISLELPLGFFVLGHFRQPADPVALQTAMQRRTRQGRDRCLQGIETVIQWQ